MFNVLCVLCFSTLSIIPGCFVLFNTEYNTAQQIIIKTDLRILGREAVEGWPAPEPCHPAAEKVFPIQTQKVYILKNTKLKDNFLFYKINTSKTQSF